MICHPNFHVLTKPSPATPPKRDTFQRPHQLMLAEASHVIILPKCKTLATIESISSFPSQGATNYDQSTVLPREKAYKKVERFSPVHTAASKSLPASCVSRCKQRQISEV